MKLLLHLTIDGESKIFSLESGELHLGRVSENDVVLPDPSVSRRHAVVRRDGTRWVIADLGSTNGVIVNEAKVQQTVLRGGERVQIGRFEIRVDVIQPPEVKTAPQSTQALPHVAPLPAAPPPPPSGSTLSSSTSTMVRPLAEIAETYGLVSSQGETAEKRLALDQAYGNRIFGFLTRLANLLLTADSVDQVLDRVAGIAFEALPVDRGFILLLNERGQIVCELARLGDRMLRRPQGEVPVSRTILETVMRERLALITYDAQSDERLASGASIRMHQIRSAMCVPLWSGEHIIGVMQVDSPVRTGSFAEADLAFLTALANYTAVAVERLRNAERVDRERRLRARLERYHSPAVIEEVMQQDETAAARPPKSAYVSVLFADLSGFTSLAETTEPATLAHFLQGFFDTAVQAIFAAGGTLDKFIGDCVMAFFGAPMPQADHAERAVQAALAIQSGLEAWNARQARQAPGQGPEPLLALRARVGINSGPVVVGEVGSSRRVDYTVLGNTVNVAQRLEESVAQVGDIVIGAETYRLLGGSIPADPLGELMLKGLKQPVTAYRLRRAS